MGRAVRCPEAFDTEELHTNAVLLFLQFTIEDWSYIILTTPGMSLPVSMCDAR